MIILKYSLLFRQLLSNGSLLIEGHPDEGDYRCLATVGGIGSILSRSARIQLACMLLA